MAQGNDRSAPPWAHTSMSRGLTLASQFLVASSTASATCTSPCLRQAHSHYPTVTGRQWHIQQAPCCHTRQASHCTQRPVWSSGSASASDTPQGHWMRSLALICTCCGTKLTSTSRLLQRHVYKSAGQLEAGHTMAAVQLRAKHTRAHCTLRWPLSISKATFFNSPPWAS